MTVRALAGLAVLNVLFLGVGLAALWAVGACRTAHAAVRYSGLGYMAGVALVGIAFCTELVVGVPFSLVSVVLTAFAIGVVAVCLRRPLQRFHPVAERQQQRPRGAGTVAAIFGLAIVVYLEALFRAGRLASLSTWDAWNFWVPKAKAIYFFGGLDEQFFRELAAPSYPPLVPALEAAAFHFMGSADVVTLHVQFWFFAFGFVAAIAGLLAERVTPLLLWPFLLLVLAAPRVVGRTLDPQGDFLLDYFFALAALLVALWLFEREPWLLAGASVFLGAALLTKREGTLLTACIVVAALVTSWRDWRFAWPRLGIAAGAAIAAVIPWRIWFSSRSLPEGLPNEGVVPPASDQLDRVWPAFQSVMTALLDFDLWLLVVPLVAVAVVLAFLAGARRLPTYALTLYALVVAGFTWVLWSFTELELPLVQDEGISPIVRLTGSLVVAAAAITPLLLDAAWRGGDPVARSD